LQKRRHGWKDSVEAQKWIFAHQAMWSGMTWRWQWQSQGSQQERRDHVPQWEVFNPNNDEENLNMVAT